MPEAIPIEIPAAPFRITDMIVEDHHHTCLRESLHCRIENFHRLFADKIWIRSQVLSIHDWIIKVLLQGVNQPYAVESLVRNVLSKLVDVHQVETVDD